MEGLPCHGACCTGDRCHPRSAWSSCILESPFSPNRQFVFRHTGHVAWSTISGSLVYARASCFDLFWDGSIHPMVVGRTAALHRDHDVSLRYYDHNRSASWANCSFLPEDESGLFHCTDSSYLDCNNRDLNPPSDDHGCTRLNPKPIFSGTLQRNAIPFDKRS